MDDHDTEPHDVGEWLDGYNRGVLAGRRDVLDIVKRYLGDGEFAAGLLLAITREVDVGAGRSG